LDKIDWIKVAGAHAEKVRPETRSKYFPQNPLRQRLIRGFLQSVGDALEPYPWRSLLDVGAGEGFVDYYLGLRFPGRAITGVEPDPTARAAAIAVNPGFTYLDADGRNLPFADGAFDAAICLEVLEHLEDYRRVLAELGRVTRGPRLVSVPAWPWYQGTNFLIGKNWRQWGEHPDHVVQFTGARLKGEMEAVFGRSVRVKLSYPWLVAVAGISGQ
jgi:SAM-dependent methyltransferase